MPFLPRDDVAFRVGARWLPSDGTGGFAVIIKVIPWAFPGNEYHYSVEYEQRLPDGTLDTFRPTCSKDIWNFQVRYYPEAT